jgi:hypothetical protein
VLRPHRLNAEELERRLQDVIDRPFRTELVFFPNSPLEFHLALFQRLCSSSHKSTKSPAAQAELDGRNDKPPWKELARLAYCGYVRIE